MCTQKRLISDIIVPLRFLFKRKKLLEKLSQKTEILSINFKFNANIMRTAIADQNRIQTNCAFQWRGKWVSIEAICIANRFRSQKNEWKAAGNGWVRVANWHWSLSIIIIYFCSPKFIFLIAPETVMENHSITAENVWLTVTRTKIYTIRSSAKYSVQGCFLSSPLSRGSALIIWALSSNAFQCRGRLFPPRWMIASHTLCIVGFCVYQLKIFQKQKWNTISIFCFSCVFFEKCYARSLHNI